MFAGCVLWVVTYLLLLSIALIGNQGVGGPLALPAGLTAVTASCIFLGWGVFAPASAIGAIFCGLLKFPRLAAIPIVTVAAFLLTYAVYWAYIELVTTHSMPLVGTVLRNFAIYLSVPLGAYWWLTEGPGALFDSFRRWVRARRNNKIISEQDAALTTRYPAASRRLNPDENPLP